MSVAGVRVTFLAAALVVAVVTSPAAAVELGGTVVAVSGDEIRIEVEGEQLPSVGDTVAIGFRIPAGVLLRVGTWRVTGVEGETVVATVVEATGKPAVGHTATISSESPTSRRRPARSQGQASQGKGEAPSPPAAGTDITVRDLKAVSSGPVIAEWVGETYLVTAAPGSPRVLGIARRAARAFRAGVKVKNIEFGEGSQRGAGLMLRGASPARSPEQDLLFAVMQRPAGDTGLALWRRQGQAWVRISVERGRPFRINPPDLGQWLEITRRGSRYEFSVNDMVVLEWEAPERDADWIGLWIGDGVRAEFLGWRVEGLE